MPETKELENEPQERGLSLRAFLLGILLIVCSNIWTTYSEYYLRSSNVGMGLVPMSIFLPFFLLIVLNTVLSRLLGRRLLTRSELLLIFIMGIAGNAANAASWLVSILATPYYFASPQNQWQSYFHSYLPKWLLPSNEGNAMRYFYEGLPRGQGIPWSVWIWPLFWWLSFIVAALIVSICLASMLRKQWVENERLTFPLVQVPQNMAQWAGKRNLPAMMTSRLFWLGFAIPFAAVAWNVLTYFFPELPPVSILNARWLRTVPYFPWLYQRLNPYVIGFGFFCNLEILFSMWFFYLLAMVQIYVYRRTGFHVGPHTEFSGDWRMVRLQACGGYLFLAAWGMWMARRHIYNILRKAWNPNCEVDDSKELLPHRVAVIGFVAGLFYVVMWMHKAGMDFYVIFFYLTIAFLFAVGFAKMVAESGLVYFGWPFDVHEFTAFTVGYASISPQTLTTLEVVHARSAVFDIMQFTHLSKIADYIRMNKRVLTVTVGLAFLFGIVFSIFFTLYMGYTKGAYNSTHWAYIRGNIWVYDCIKRKMKDPNPIDWAKMCLVWAGIIITAFITFMRYRFPWFRLHPIGFTVSVQWFTRISFMSIFLVWCVKAIFLKLGGVRIIRQLEPFFLGMLCGFATGVLLSFVVDCIWFPFQGHLVHY